jgi:uncharacterized protein YxjI
MRYLMKQKIWALGDDFTVKDQAGKEQFFIDGKAISLGDKLSFQDMHHNELAFIKQKLLSWGPTYEIWNRGRLFAVVKEHLWSLMKYRFTVDVNADGPGPGDLEIEGDFFSHEYSFMRGNQPVAQVSMQWFSWADTYGVEVAEGEDPVLILACTVIVDMVTRKHKNNG